MSRRRVCRVLADGVGVLVSTGLTCVVGAVVPAAVGSVWFFGGLGVLVVLLCGRGERLAVRVLCWARPLRDFEDTPLRPVVAVLQEHDLTSPPPRLLVRGNVGGIWAGHAGRRHLVISTGLVAAADTGRVRPDELAALMAHALARQRLGWTRYDLALEFWLLPWRILQGFALGAIQRLSLSRAPLTGFAWRLRFIVGAVTPFTSAADGQTVFGILGAGLIALTYLVPWARRQAELGAENESDQFVARAGLGDALIRFLRRGPQTPRVRQRIHRLQGTGQESARTQNELTL